MPQQVRFRTQKTLNYVANGKQVEQLSRGMVYREMFLRLVGAPTVTLGNNTQAKTLRGDEWSLIKKIEIIANNTDVLKSFSGNDLWWLNYFWYGAAPHITSNLGDGATANVPFDSTLIIPFWMPNSLRPIDTALDARELSDLKIEVTWGDHLDMNADNTGFTTAPTLEVNSLESFLVKGPFAQWRVYTLEKEITASSTQFQILLPVGPMYRGFTIITTDDDVEVSGILNNLKLKSGTTVFADMPGEVLQQVGSLRAGIGRGHTNGAAVDYLALRRGAGNSYLGVYNYDHVTDGFKSESIDTLGFSEFELELDVSVGSGTTKIYVIPQVIIPVRGGQKA